MSKNFLPARRIINATVLPAELAKGIAEQKHLSGEGVREFVRQSRCHNQPGTNRELVNELPADEEYMQNGDVVTKRSKTKTIRKSH